MPCRAVAEERLSKTKPRTVARSRNLTASSNVFRLGQPRAAVPTYLSSTAEVAVATALIHFVELDSIAGVNGFHGEDNHSGGGGWRHADDDDLTDGAARQVADVNHRSVRLGEHGRVHGRCFLLRVFGDGGLEGKRVDRIEQVGIVGADGAEVVAHLHALVRTQVDVELMSGAHLRIEILAHHDASTELV